MTLDEAKKMIDQEIKAHDIVVFMKGTPEFPQCGFSGRVISIFNHFGHKVRGINVLEDESVRQGIKEYSNWPTVPQIYIKGEFIGGCDITSEMAQTGELQKLLEEKLGATSANAT